MVDTIYNLDTFDIPEIEKPQNIGNIDTASIIVILHKDDYNIQKQLLHKILKAINVDVDKDVLFLLLEEGASCPLYQYANDNTQYVMSFGLGIKALGLNAKFVANHFYNTETYAVMLTHSLTKLSMDNQKKKALWSALQNVFK
jgi:DNA polymerase III psi subunit